MGDGWLGAAGELADDGGDPESDRAEDAGSSFGDAAAHGEAFVVLFDLGFGDGPEVAHDVVPAFLKLGLLEALEERLLEGQGEEGAERWPRMASSVWWKTGRVSRRDLAVRKVRSTIHNCL